MRCLAISQSRRLEKFLRFPTTSYSHKSKMRSDQPHKRQESGPGYSGLPLAENIKGLAMQNKCIISMHSQARATAFFAWGQMRLFFVSLTVINVIIVHNRSKCYPFSQINCMVIRFSMLP